MARRLVRVVMAILFAAPGWAQSREAQTWRAFAASLKPGALVELDLRDGTWVEGTLLSTATDTLVINPRTRIPVATWTIAYSEIVSMAPGRDGLKPGLKVAIGIGVGAAVTVLVTALLAIAIGD
jgi:hypothetical protein